MPCCIFFSQLQSFVRDEYWLCCSMAQMQVLRTSSLASSGFDASRSANRHNPSSSASIATDIADEAVPSTVALTALTAFLTLNPLDTTPEPEDTRTTGNLPGEA
jgi:hypothetical protein